jgi:hypothetical protein
MASPDSNEDCDTIALCAEPDRGPASGLNEGVRTWSRSKLLGSTLAVLLLLLFAEQHGVERLETALRGDFCPHAPAHPQDRRTERSTLRIVTVNAEYLMHDPEVGCRRQWQGCPWRNATASRTHLENVAKMLANLDADMINLTEVSMLVCSSLYIVLVNLPVQCSHPCCVHNAIKLVRQQ